jgi:hypothetical protein
VIKCKQYPLPIITDVLCKHIGYKFFIHLEISMQYNILNSLRRVKISATPFRKYKYTHLPLGLRCSPDIAQAVMENVLSRMDAADVC